MVQIRALTMLTAQIFSTSDSANSASKGRMNELQPLNMNIKLPTTVAYRLIRSGSTAVLMVGVSMFVLCLALFLARQHQVIDQRANSSDGLQCPIPPDEGTSKTSIAPNSASGSSSLASDTFRALSQLDHKFLDASSFVI